MSDTAFYRQLLAAEPGLAPVRAQLAGALLAGGDLEGAATEASTVLEWDEALAEGWSVRAAARKGLRRFAEAAADFERAAALAPDRPFILINLASCYAELGRLRAAEACLRRVTQLSPRIKEAHANLGSVLVRLGRKAEAVEACRAALQLDPGMISAHQNLSGLLAESEPAIARAHRDTAYTAQQIFIDRAPNPERTVLVLCAADAGNVPISHLLPRDRTTLIRWYVEYALPDQDRFLPPFDLVFNAMGDPDWAPALPPPAIRLLHAYPAINDPARVALTRRCDLPALLEGIPGVAVPAVKRLEPGRPAPALTFPVLLRPTGSHGGEGARRVDSLPELDGPHYATEFVDTRSPDGFYRKYRFIFVDRLAYPYHLAISPDWLVHYWTAGMEGDPARLDEERRFLADPVSAIGPRAMTALHAIAARLDLDYAGIDFGLLPDGRILVFEANATMLVHPEDRVGPLAFRNPAVAAIQAAFEAMLPQWETGPLARARQASAARTGFLRGLSLV